MTRRTFLESAVMAPLATTAVVGSAADLGGGSSAAKAKHKIRRGVASYSYQEEFMAGVMSLEDVLREMSDIGATSIELLAEMMVPDFPNPSEAWVQQWHEWVERYNIVPSAYTQFIDSMRTKTHNLTIEEGVATFLRDIKLAKRLKIPCIRALIGTPIDILEATIPHLEKHDIWLGVELHSPIQIDGPLMNRLLQIAEKSSHFGLVPDFGIFQNKPNVFQRARYIREGKLTLDAALYIENSWENKVRRDVVTAEVKKMGGGAGAQTWVGQVYGIATQDSRKLIPIMAKCRHIHGKTWGLTENCSDPAIDISNVIPNLIAGGYDGAIATEYEGQRFVQDVEPFSAVEMVRRHHVLLRHLLGEI